MNDLLAYANEYIALGLRVIALTDKMPNGAVHPHGLYDAFSLDTPLQGLDDAFTHPKTTGIGILTGGPFFVVDIDGEEGAVQWKEIAGEADFMPDAWVAKTGRGLHLYYATWTPRKTRKLGPKLDLKGEGGYVAAPPSRHPDGHLYSWLLAPGSQRMQEAPPYLTALLDRDDALRDQAAIAKAANKQVRHSVLEDGKIWNTIDFSGVIDAVRAAAPGKRNELLNWAAYTMASDGANEEEFVELAEAAREAGLLPRETRLTIRSGQKAAGRG